MELDQVRAFLALCEELHFGRTAERLFLTQPRVSKLISSLETEIGGQLFDRTSRRVVLTSLGSELECRLRPAYTDLIAARDAARNLARSTSGSVRIGVPPVIEPRELMSMIADFSAQMPDCTVTFVEVDIWDPLTPLREGQFDILCNWLVFDEPDLTVGPVLGWHARALAVAVSHPLAQRATVSLEEVVPYRWMRPPTRMPRAIVEAFQPVSTPRGVPISRTEEVIDSYAEVIAQVARGNIVALTVRDQARYGAREDIALVPVSDMPPLPLGLMWSTARDNPRIRALVAAVSDRCPQVIDRDSICR